ncbi:MAG: hypothetical protein ACNA8W_06220 [Bradymonadaceae bacterium]
MKSSPKNIGLISALVLVLILISLPGVGAAQQTSDTDAGLYASTYGEGLRHYVEGRYDQAVEMLFRAYALKPTPSTARLLVRSYDFMGHCGAASRQLEFFREAHPRDQGPTLQRCERPASLVIDCEPYGAPVHINRFIAGHCGATIAVAPGIQNIQRDGDKRAGRRVEVGADEVATISLGEMPGSAARGKAPSAHAPDVSRLTSTEGSYRVIQSRDGLYQIWVRSDLGEDPDMFPLDSLRFRPYVEIICADEGKPGADNETCVMLRELQQKRRDYTDNPQRFEVVIPRVP